MSILHIALYSLLATSLVFSIVELGLSAYVVSISSGTYTAGYGYFDYTYHVKAPAIVSFLVFCSVWSMLITAAALGLSWFYTRKGASSKLSNILGIVFAVVYGVTMVFWLASFADIASDLDNVGYDGVSDYVNAVLAFAVLLWLLFVALFVLSILALCGVLSSDWVGYQSMRGARTEKAAAPAPAPEVPMSTNPVASPSELSTRDAEVLHDQPNNLPSSHSPPSAIASVELSGDNVHDQHASHA